MLKEIIINNDKYTDFEINKFLIMLINEYQNQKNKIQQLIIDIK